MHLLFLLCSATLFLSLSLLLVVVVIYCIISIITFCINYEIILISTQGVYIFLLIHLHTVGNVCVVRDTNYSLCGTQLPAGVKPQQLTSCKVLLAGEVKGDVLLQLIAKPLNC